MAAAVKVIVNQKGWRRQIDPCL